MSRQYAKSEHTLHNSQCTATWVIPTWNAQKGGLHAHTSYKWLAFVKKRGRNSDVMHKRGCTSSNVTAKARGRVGQCHSFAIRCT